MAENMFPTTHTPDNSGKHNGVHHSARPGHSWNIKSCSSDPHSTELCCTGVSGVPCNSLLSGWPPALVPLFEPVKCFPFLFACMKKDIYQLILRKLLIGSRNDRKDNNNSRSVSLHPLRDKHTQHAKHMRKWRLFLGCCYVWCRKVQREWCIL